MKSMKFHEKLKEIEGRYFEVHLEDGTKIADGIVLVAPQYPEMFYIATGGDRLQLETVHVKSITDVDQCKKIVVDKWDEK